MPTPPYRPLLAATLLAAISAPAMAQVTTSSSALDALGPSNRSQPAHHAAAHAKPHSSSSHGQTQTRATTHKSARQANAVAPGRAPAATIPAAPPPPPVFTAPVINVPLHPPAPPPPVPVVQTATGVATPLPDGVRITFGADSSDVNPATMQALNDFAATVKAAPGARAVLDAAAAGSPDDPSTPRRLALSRGLAARAVLINDGIASTRIYVRMDPSASAGTARVDLHLQSNPDTAPAASPAPSPTASTMTPPAVSPAASPAPAAVPGPSQP